ncbi:hypothetical protein SAMN05444398_101813 [Roseovarius pacificus]|uniref:Uncharacterized protein n=1 Tax=Roseovarius pacificus TaxID=337701 RepID=A0A1M6YE60_9RHOB|nr:hypothetical protein [Roseovarius pacificus]GGO51009.1 hypothetical protein GCM10011315_03130 [Roseovarius pacificus]SHL16315.1 hypothetical protein SAMN05444398_101813 [Roseovarius pacificus]
MEQTQSKTIPPRAPNVVMTLARLGSFHQSRLSFMRILLRRMEAEQWTFERPVFDIDAQGMGRAVYTAHGPERSYSLVAFANDLPPEKRSDRVIATEWDATFTLFDGIPTPADLDRLQDNVPQQEAGRVTESELSISRANRSVRLWDYVVGKLAAGEQPDRTTVEKVGYLMRTTAVYGSGKFGAADREDTAERPEFQAPFQIEMLSVYLTRAFVMDLVEHMARMRAPDTAVPLDPDLRRRFGIGNSTGLGMAPFLLTHPALLNNWIAAREEALARIRSLPAAHMSEVDIFRNFALRARLHMQDWYSEHPVQIARIDALRADTARLLAHLDTAELSADHPWNRLWLWAEDALSLEGQELLASLLMEPYPHLVDGLSACMAADEAATWRIDGAMSTDRLRTLTRDIYRWALDTDWTAPEAQARVWYTSEEKLEPRLGDRHTDPVEPYEQPLCPGRDAARMYGDLTATGETTVAGFLMRHPEHRHIVRRAQIAARLPYAEIRDNTIAATVLPIDMLRMKLAFFGACHFDPRSDRWVRINMYQHAPFPHELGARSGDDWAYPFLTGAAS